MISASTRSPSACSARALAVIGLNEASHAMFHHEEHEFAGYHVANGELKQQPVRPLSKARVDYGTLLAAADVAKGAEHPRNACSATTSNRAAPTLQGPHLYGVLGRDIASVAGFKYSTGARFAVGTRRRVDLRETGSLHRASEGLCLGDTLMNFAGINSRITGLSRPHQPDRLPAHAGRRRHSAAGPAAAASRRSGGWRSAG